MTHPKVIFRILGLDPGGEAALVWGKREAIRLASLPGSRAFTCNDTIDDFQVQVRGAHHTSGEFVVYLTVTFVPFSQLYNWPDNDLAFTLPPRKFRLLSAPTAGQPVLDPSTVISASSGVTPLAAGLAFNSSGVASVQFLESITMTGLTGQLARCVRNDDWFAYRLLDWLISRTTFTRNGASLRVLREDVLLSPWANGTFWLLLGSFPQAGELPMADAGQPLVQQPYQGVAIRWDAFLACLTTSTPTVFTANLDSVALLDPFNTVQNFTRNVTTGYTRTQLGTNVAGSLTEISSKSQRVSPFAARYEYDTAFPIDFDGGVGTSSFLVHTLSTNGVPVKTDPTLALQVGTSNGTITSTGLGNSLSGLVCDLTLFDGQNFVKYGQHTFSGAAGNRDSILTFTDLSDLPLSITGSAPAPLDIRGFVREYAIALVNASPGLAAWPVDGKRTFNQQWASTINDMFSADLAPPYAGITPQLVNSEASDSPSHTPNFLLTQTVFGEGPPVNLGMAVPELPPIANQPKIGGAFWHRDGPPGVFLFQVPDGAASSRTADCTKYQHVYLGDVGYRRLANGTVETGWEDPNAILARISKATDVLVNNFASPALFAWLDLGVIGVILDP